MNVEAGKMVSMKGMYEIAFEGWKTDTARFWTLFSVMSVLNGALMAGLSLGGEDASDKFADWRIGVSVLGIVLCYLWYGIQHRMSSWCSWWDKKLESLEPEYRATASRLNVGTGVDNEAIFEGRKSGGNGPGISTRVAGRVTPLLFGVGWVFAANRELQFMTPDVLKALAGLVLVLTSPLCLILGSKLVLAASKNERWWERLVTGYVLCAVGIALIVWFATSLMEKVFL